MKNRISRRSALAGMGLFTGAAFLESCAVNPVTGKREFMLMGEDEEINMGKEAHGQIVEEYGAYGDSSMQDWFTARGNEMTPFSHRKHLPWQFTVLDSPVINAFAVPGGNIYVTRGILAYFNNEAQFAGVFGRIGRCKSNSVRYNTYNRYTTISSDPDFGAVIGNFKCNITY